MQPRFSFVAHALRTSQPWTRIARPNVRPRATPFVCPSCQNKFSTSAILRRVAHASKQAFRNATRTPKGKAGYATGAENAKDRYPQNLLIYEAGDMRSTWVSFWKVTALFQAIACTVVCAPMLYRNENQPDSNVRLFQAVGITAVSFIPFCLMSYLTSPFVRSVHLRLPVYATRSLSQLLRFSINPPADTLIEFTTLRAVGFQRRTTVLMHELRALPTSPWRFANIERIKSDYLLKDEKSKSVFRKMLTVLSEPRFKFYVKEGRVYTIVTKVPGVWENIAAQIRRQTDEIASGVQGLGSKPVQAQKPMTKVIEKEKVEAKRLKRQTSRLPR